MGRAVLRQELAGVQVLPHIVPAPAQPFPSPAQPSSVCSRCPAGAGAADTHTADIVFSLYNAMHGSEVDLV